MAGWQDAPEVGGASAPAWAAAPVVDALPAEGSRARAAKQADGVLTKAVLNFIPAALVRGPGSIGASLMAPFDKLGDVVSGITGEGEQAIPRNEERRAGMDAGLTELVGTDPNNPGYKLGKVVGEIAGTSGTGGALARGAAAIPGVAAKMPGLVNAIRTGGMAAGPAAPGVTGAAANLATRAAGGAVTGGASAGLVDPSQAEAGMLISAGLPVAAKIAGATGRAAGRMIAGPAQAPDLAKAIAEARAAGFVIPPSQARPNLVNRALEGFAGKASTAQNASVRNADTVANLAAQDLGLPAGTKITPGLLNGIRDRASQPYKAIGATGVVTPSQAYEQALDAIQQPYLLTAGAFPGADASPVVKMVDQMRSPAFASAAAVEKIKQLRSAADGAFRRGDNDVGRASRALASALEDAVEEHLQKIGQPQLLQQFRDGRQLIAKTYSVQDALNAETGSVSARKLASQLQDGKPLSGGIEQAARFAARFPKAVQNVEGLGSLPQTSPLDWHSAAALSLATGNPTPMAGVVARPVTRALALSPIVQNRLVAPQGPGAIARLFANPMAQQLGYRAAPVALTDR